MADHRECGGCSAVWYSDCSAVLQATPGRAAGLASAKMRNFSPSPRFCHRILQNMCETRGGICGAWGIFFFRP